FPAGKRHGTPVEEIRCEPGRGKELFRCDVVGATGAARNLVRCLEPRGNRLSRVRHGERILRDEPDCRSELLHTRSALACNVAAVEQHPALRGFDAPVKHVDQCGLADSGWTDESKRGVAFAQSEVDATEYIHPWVPCMDSSGSESRGH